MSRVEGNKYMQEHMDDALLSFAKSAARVSDQTAISVKMTFILNVLTDISASLAVIADEMTGEIPIDKPQEGCYLWHYAKDSTPQKHERVIVITQNGIEYEAYFDNDLWHTNEGTSFTTEYVKLWRIIGGED